MVMGTAKELRAGGRAPWGPQGSQSLALGSQALPLAIPWAPWKSSTIAADMPCFKAAKPLNEACSSIMSIPAASGGQDKAEEGQISRLRHKDSTNIRLG